MLKYCEEAQYRAWRGLWARKFWCNANFTVPISGVYVKVCGFSTVPHFISGGNVSCHVKSCGSHKILNVCTFLFSCMSAHWLDWSISLVLFLHLCQWLTTFLRQILKASSEQQTKHHRNGKKDNQIIASFE